MPALQRQIEELFERILLKRLQQGKPPSTWELSQEVEKFLKDRPSGGPVMRVRTQGRRKAWDVSAQNQVLEELEIDFKVLFEEMTDLTRQLLARHNFTEVAYQAQSRQLSALTSELDNLLFVTQNTDDRFFGVFDSFDDLSKVDMEMSTEGVVDLSEGVILLPSGALSTHKIPMTHLYEAGSWAVGAKSDVGNVIENRTGTDAAFGNAFHDVVSAWRQDVTVDRQGPVSVSFTIPIAAESGQEISLTRIQVISHSVHPMGLTIETSTDNVNYTKIPEGSELSLDTSDREYNIDFPRRRMQYLRFTLKKAVADEDLTGLYRYSFGLKHLGFYTVGRAVRSEMQSRPLRPEGMVSPISQVSVSAIEKVPATCTARWFLKGLDHTGGDIGDWRPVSPVTRTNPSLPTIVRFGNDRLEKKRLGSGSSLWSSYRNNNIYALTDSALPSGEDTIDVVFGTGRLLRGLSAWARNRRYEKVLKKIRDAYVTFDSGNRQTIAVALTEGAKLSLRASPSRDALVTYLRVLQPIDYNPEDMQVIPGSYTDVQQDVTDRYAIHKILVSPSVLSYSDQDLSGTGGLPTALSHPNVVISGSEVPVVKDSAPNSTTYVEGRDYEFSRDPVTNRVLFKRLQTATSQIPQNAVTQAWSVKITYTLDTDVTGLVETVNGKNVIMTVDLNQEDDAKFNVTYRSIPTGDYKIVKSSVRVTSNFGQDEGFSYVEGRDYTIDIERGVMTRIPQGQILDVGNHTAVYVDFVYEAPSLALETFTTWVFNEKKEPQRIEFSELGLDLNEGEQFFIRQGGSSTELTRGTESPELLYGWAQFTVRSKDPDSNVTSAASTVADLRDRAGNPVFVAGGRYFSQMYAMRDPMTQVEEDFLLTNVLPANHKNFAITNTGQVLVNFQPGTTTDLYLYGPRLDDAGSYVFEERTEEFEIQFRRRLATTVEVESVKVKVVLEREALSDGGLTPKVFRYNLRIG